MFKTYINSVVLGKSGHLRRNRFLLNSERTQLTVPNVSMSDAMCVHCMVENEHGHVTSSGCLTVEGETNVLNCFMG